MVTTKKRQGTMLNIPTIAWPGVIVGLVLAFGAARALAASPEYQMKAAFLYNFAKLIEWPGDAFSSPNAPVNLCILGDSPFGDALDGISGRAVDANRKVAVKRLARGDDAKGCHIEFVSESEKANFAKVIDAAKNLPILTVSEADGFTKAGGVINLSKVDNKVSIRLNIKAAQQARLKLSPQILKLATTE